MPGGEVEREEYARRGGYADRGARRQPSAAFSPREREEIEADLAAEPITDADVLKLVLGDWEVKTRKGESVPYSLSTLAELSEELDGFEAGFVRAYFAARRAAENPEEQEKNSAPQSAAT